MDRKVWIIRAQTHRFGWSDYPAIYGDVLHSLDAALSLAEKLNAEYNAKGIPNHFSVYECTCVSEYANRVHGLSTGESK